MVSFQKLIYLLKARNITKGEQDRRYYTKVLKMTSSVPLGKYGSHLAVTDCMPLGEFLALSDLSCPICKHPILPDQQSCWEANWKTIWKVPHISCQFKMALNTKFTTRGKILERSPGRVEEHLNANQRSFIQVPCPHWLATWPNWPFLCPQPVTLCIKWCSLHVKCLPVPILSGHRNPNYNSQIISLLTSSGTLPWFLPSETFPSFI